MSVDVDRIIQRAMDLSCGQDAMRDKVVARIYQEAESLANEVVLVEKPARDWDGWTMSSPPGDLATPLRWPYWPLSFG